MDAAAILALIKLIQDLTPEAAAAIRDLFDKLSGMTPEQIVALTHQINQSTVAMIDKELGTSTTTQASAPPATSGS